MNSHGQFSLRARLIFIVIVPLLGLLYFSISNTIQKAGSYHEMVRLESLVTLSVKIGALAHELQKERGMTAGFLGSHGAKFTHELPSQHKDTDKKIGSM